MKRNGYYCEVCDMVVFDVAEYERHEDHTCDNCCDFQLVPVVVTDEPLIGGAK